MKKTVKRTFALLVAFMAVSMAGVAQAPTFTDQTQFVVAKGSGSVNIRKAPNTKAAKVGSIPADFTFPVLQEKDGWYQVVNTEGETGWVSATVTRINDATLNADKVCDHLYGMSDTYEDYAEWYVGRVKDTDIYLAITSQSNMFEQFPFPGWGETLWMGKKVGNVLVFDQYLIVNTSESDDAGELKLIDDDSSDDKVWYLRYGDSYSMPDNQGGKKLRLSSLPQNTVRKMFDGRQKKDRLLFLGPQLFVTKYANVVFG